MTNEHKSGTYFGEDLAGIMAYGEVQDYKTGEVLRGATRDDAERAIAFDGNKEGVFKDEHGVTVFVTL